MSRVAQLLQQSPHKPVLVTEAVNFDQDDKPVEVSSGCYASGRVALMAIS
ncbi:UTRA domain-containing protein [Belnapia sp. T6]|uniref:UTRA domain-containing protein n=1 Tax=Belnapia mucosa TaxID=2804532 RepID=A0ABS1VC64_9PROT|nr:UTRA domain-containing protein [Belnapia mucosa]